MLAELKATQLVRCYPNRHGILGAELLGGHVQSCDAAAVFFEILFVLVGQGCLAVNRRRPEKHDHIRIGVSCIEIQCHVAICGNVLEFVRMCLRIDENGVAIPPEPHGAGLRGAVRAGSGQPDFLLIFEASFCLASEFCVEVYHSWQEYHKKVDFVLALTLFNAHARIL